MGKDKRKKKKKICKIVVDVTNRKWKKKKVGYKTDELNNEEMNKWKKNKSNEVNDTIVERDCNCYQLKIFVKKVSVEWKRWKKNEWRWGGRHANRSWVTCNRDNICVWDLKVKQNGSIDPKKISTSEWGLALIFGVWNQKKKWKKNGQTRWQMKVECVRSGEWGSK